MCHSVSRDDLQAEEAARIDEQCLQNMDLGTFNRKYRQAGGRHPCALPQSQCANLWRPALIANGKATESMHTVVFAGGDGGGSCHRGTGSCHAVPAAARLTGGRHFGSRPPSPEPSLAGPCPPGRRCAGAGSTCWVSAICPQRRQHITLRRLCSGAKRCGGRPCTAGTPGSWRGSAVWWGAGNIGGNFAQGGACSSRCSSAGSAATRGWGGLATAAAAAAAGAAEEEENCAGTGRGV